MKVLLLPLRWIYNIYAALLFIALMLVVFIPAIIASFFGRIRGGNMVLRLCMFWADVWFPLVFIFHKKIYEVPHLRSRSYIFLSNHISYLDAAILVKAYRQPIRPLGKVEMAKLPVFGFIYRNAIVTVDRSSATNRANSVRVLKSIIGKGISVLVFPEGTFNETTMPVKEFYDGAFRVAIETQTPIKPVLFLDAYRRMPFHGWLTITPGISRVLYLDEIPVEGLTLADLPALKNKTHEIMTRKMIEYNGGWRKG